MKIIIEGKSGEGKTGLASLIRTTLQRKGIEVELAEEGLQEVTTAEQEDRVELILLNMSSQKKVVKIETRQKGR